MLRWDPENAFLNVSMTRQSLVNLGCSDGLDAMARSATADTDRFGGVSGDRLDDKADGVQTNNVQIGTGRDHDGKLPQTEQ